MVDSAGGRSQVAQLTAGVLVLFVLLFLTGPISDMPKAVLASVVFIIGIELIDYRTMARIRKVRLDEFIVAGLTALTVIVVGVEQGIILAIVASMVAHLRRSYHPHCSVLAIGGGHPAIRADPVAFDARTVPGLVIYRFSAGLYYANSHMLLNDITGFAEAADKPELSWFCIDAGAIDDVDYTGAQVLEQGRKLLEKNHVRLVFTHVLDPVRKEFDRYGLTEALGPDPYLPTVPDVIAAYEKRKS
jgi:MFS superfamily sulfate permease-like transporter